MTAVLARPSCPVLIGDLHHPAVDEVDRARGPVSVSRKVFPSSTPVKAMFQMMGVFAEFERAMIRVRIKAGLARARAQGKTLGRPTISAATDAAIRKALKKGDIGIRKIATTLGVGTGTAQRIRAEMVS